MNDATGLAEALLGLDGWPSPPSTGHMVMRPADRGVRSVNSHSIDGMLPIVEWRRTAL
jgi:hypothetical protein